MAIEKRFYEEHGDKRIYLDSNHYLSKCIISMTDQIEEHNTYIFLNKDELKQFIEELNIIYFKINEFENKLKEVSNG